jgi:hypothetical protein
MRKLGFKDQEAREVWMRAESITAAVPAAVSVGSIKAGSLARASEFIDHMIEKVMTVVPRQVLLNVLVPLGIGAGILLLTGSALLAAAAVLVVVIIMLNSALMKPGFSCGAPARC